MIVNTEGPINAKIFLVGEAPGKDEDMLGKPFRGYAGKTLNWLLGSAGINRAECLVGNVARKRPPNNKMSYYFQDTKCTIPTPELREWIEQLKKELQMYKPNIVVPLGAYALWALTGQKTISKYRGYLMESTLVPGLKVLPTYHPQNINYEWKNHFPTIMDLRKAKRHSTSKAFPSDNRTRVEKAGPTEFIQYLDDIYNDNSDDPICLDLETTIGENLHTTIVGIATSPTYGMSIQLVSGKYANMSENVEVEFWRKMALVLDKKKVIIQNAAFDKGVVWYRHRIFIRRLWMDTLIAAHVLWPELPRDLGFLASILLDVPQWKLDKNLPTYNVDDVVNTYGIAMQLYKEIHKKPNMVEQFNFEMSLIDPALMMQLQGLRVDLSIKEELTRNAEERVVSTKKALHDIIGREVNYNSPKQLKKLLYIDMKLPVQYKRRKSRDDERKMTADAEALRKLSRIIPDNPIFNLILEHKKYLKLLNGFLNAGVSPDNTVHTSYNITGSSTDEEGRRSFGRWSSSGSIILPYGSGNLQNIPSEIRTMFRPEPGYIVIQADYVQAEAVVVAFLINDVRMKNNFKQSFGLRGEAKTPYDIHKLTAASMWGIPVEEVTKEQRQVGKTLRHATNYSAGPAVVATKLGIELSSAKKLLDQYMQSIPQLKLWQMRIQEHLRVDRTMYNLFGRPHRFLDRYDDDMFRSAYSYIPQSTVGDLLNRALRRIYDIEDVDMRIWIQLHDAIYVVTKEENLALAVRAMRKAMIEPITTPEGESFVIDVDFKVGPSWGDGKELDEIKLIKEVFDEDCYSRLDQVFEHYGVIR